MKTEDLKASLDRVRPDDAAKGRMLHNVLIRSGGKKGIFMRPLLLRKAVPVFILAAVLTGGLLTYDMLTGAGNENPPQFIADDSAREDMAAPLLNQFRLDDMSYILLSDELRADFGFPAAISDGDIGEKLADITSGPDKSLIGGEVYRYTPAGGDAIVAVKKDGVYQLFRFFTFESYENNQDEDAARYLELYGIDGADDIAKVQLIGYSEQAKLRGVPDIVGEIADRDEIGRFYSFYSVLKNSSDVYFKKLFSFGNPGSAGQGGETGGTEPAILPEDIIVPDGRVPDAAPPDAIDPAAPVRPDHAEDMPAVIEPDAAPPAATDPAASERANHAEDMPMYVEPDKYYGADTPNMGETRVSSGSVGMVDMGGSGSGQVAPSQGFTGDALADPITIRIYNNNGVYYDSIYYMNIGFISRFEVSKEFADFINEYVNK